MIKQIYRDIKRGIDVRQNLSELRKQVRDAALMEELFELVNDDTQGLCQILYSEDAKTRKNCALLMGELQIAEFEKPLWEAYQREQQMFVRPAFLQALRSYEIKEHIPELKEHMEKLQNASSTEESQKHIEEELRAIRELIHKYEKSVYHEFAGIQSPVECILLTNRFHKEVTEEQISQGRIIPFSAGVRVKTTNLNELLLIRTYSELLFVIGDEKNCPSDPVAAAKWVANSNLFSFIKESHRGRAPYYFRTEYKSKETLDKKSLFAKRFSTELERNSGREFINQPGDYEFEIRLIENKNNTLAVLLKLNTIKDERFSYRKAVIPTSIKPFKAAILVALAKEYMKKDAQILDPFCGVGTMLIERQKIVKGNTSYGIDVYAEAIQKAKINTEAAGQIIHYVNKDIFEFTHDYLFDEVFTDMPFAIGKTSEKEIYELYKKFFFRIPMLLKKKSSMILYSRNVEYIEKFAPENGFEIIRDFEIDRKENAHLVILS